MQPIIIGEVKERVIQSRVLHWQAHSLAVLVIISSPPVIWKMHLIHVTGARVFVSLDNFFTFTKYSGYDPEFSYDSSPTGDSYGADFGEQATLKSFIIGASINF